MWHSPIKDKMVRAGRENTAYFLNLEQMHYNEKDIHRLVRDDEVELRAQADMQFEQATYYESRDDEIENMQSEALISGRMMQ